MWKPIETVPKDGREVLLTDGYRIAVATWEPKTWPYADQTNSCWSISDWHNDQIHLRGGYRASMWTEVPALPNGDQR